MQEELRPRTRLIRLHLLLINMTMKSWNYKDTMMNPLTQLDLLHLLHLDLIDFFSSERRW